MLFNSHVFLFLFLPATALGYLLLSRAAPRRVALAWLVACSLFYYGWWDPGLLPLLLFSVAFNFAIGLLLPGRAGTAAGRMLLALGVATNLGLLGWFKYAGFAVHTLNLALGASLHLEPIALPLAISFFTFQQIAYLVDAYRREAREYHPVDYSLFVTFFPQLIAGPIVHHKEMLPQFESREHRPFRAEDLSVGLTIAAIGLFKKVVIADQMALYSTPVFDGALAGSDPTFAESWIAALSYSLQLYFDFSGYSDMAIGFARIFGIRLPINFDSPYKATSIIDFWRRWHVTLSRFLRDYLYIPLGGNRRGRTRRYVNLMITMLLGGLWHGAGWTFVAWGGIHGLYLLANHAWRRLRGEPARDRSPLAAWGGRGLTFLSVVVAWVLFRAESFDAALRMLRAMAGMGGLDLSVSAVSGASALPWLLALLPAVMLLPNTQQLLRSHRPALDAGRRRPAPAEGPALEWRPNAAWAALAAAALLLSVMNLSRASEFIYFQF